MAQKSIHYFAGFKRGIKFRGEFIECAPENNCQSKEKKVLSRICSKPFLTAQGRAQHEVGTHKDIEIVNPSTCTGREFENAVERENSVDLENAVKHENGSTPSANTVIDIDDESDCVPNKRRGADSRMSYSNHFKMRVLEFSDANQLSDSEIAEYFKIHRTLVIKWKGQRAKIENAACVDEKKLLRKIRPSVKYQQVYAKLYQEVF